MSESASADAVTLGFLLGALGSTVVSLQVAPAGTTIPIRSVSLLDTDDLAAAEPGARMADLCVLAGVSAEAAVGWIGRLSAEDSPSALVIKDASADAVPIGRGRGHRGGCPARAGPSRAGAVDGAQPAGGCRGAIATGSILR